ncbi:hypothetical protein [Solimonas soli]|uniref:hypothetical protein n=1 Tax=Solimonas soli TaxID=413479 RepID=UPI0004803B2F|nr:hypothetical protein [Solimonas soli]
MSAHPLQWQTPAPLWARFGSGADAASADDQRRPALLRFASDDFMEQILGLLARDPQQLGSLLARPETWRKPMADAPDLVERVAVPRRLRGLAKLKLQAQSRTAIAPVAASATVVEKMQTRVLPLKLYQPAHQRYYLVSASLVCGVSGLPERAVTRGTEELGFVIRRLLPESPNDPASPLREFAYLKDAQAGRWQRAATGAEAALLAGEELLPLFPLNFRDAQDHARTLWSGFVPVARREEYMGASVVRGLPTSMLDAQRADLRAPGAAAPASGITARKTQFLMEVAEPWKNIVRAAVKARGSMAEAKPDGLDGSGETDAQKRGRVYALNLQWQMPSWLILLDFADYLAMHLADVWQAVQSGNAGALSASRKTLYDALGAGAMPLALQNALRRPSDNAELKSSKANLREALKRIVDFRDALEGAQRLYGESSYNGGEWPDFHFLLAGLDTGRALSGAVTTFAAPSAADADEVPSGPIGGSESAADAEARQAADRLDSLSAMVARCLVAQVESEAPAPPLALQLRDAYAANAASGNQNDFVIRCVHRNRDCGPLHPPTLSAPTQRFQLANFFDSDAPARPIRITLPLDTTPAGLRKFNKNTAFVISDVLCGQIQRAKGLGLGDLVRSVLPWPLHKDLDLGDGGACNNGSLNIGMICSLSIPIITICALLLLMIIVSLLDFIFRWLPFFIFCFPVPGLKGKK